MSAERRASMRKDAVKKTEIQFKQVELAPHIVEGVESFIGKLEGFNEKLPRERQRPPEDFAFLRDFYPSFIQDRNLRAQEVNLPEYREVVDRANEQLPMSPLAVMCMDGRVKLIHVFGFGAGIGSSIRVPGGLLKEFVRKNDGGMHLKEDSHFAKRIDHALAKNDSIAEIFDSHWGCAARKGEESARGNTPNDDGLLSDVLHKREMANATKKYTTEKHPDKHVAIVQTTFNPITGFLYMGLDRAHSLDHANQFARSKAEERGEDPNLASPTYSKEVMKSLILEGQVISTGHLLTNPKIKAVFDAHFFDVSWKHRYIDTSKKFWDAIVSMKDEVLPLITHDVLNVFPELGTHQKKQQREIEERAMLLLCNAFNGFLHNRGHNELEYLDVDDHAYGEKGHYEYDTHNEEGIKVSEGGHPPYEIAMFVIMSGNPHQTPADIELASGIVRQNRALGRIHDRSGSYSSQEQFAKASVPVVIQQIVRDQRVTEQDWKVLEDIDWGNLNELAWEDMSDREFYSYLQSKANLTTALANAINTLRHQMAEIYHPDAPTATHVIDLFKTIMPIVCDQDRRTHAIIPFMRLGYTS